MKQKPSPLSIHETHLPNEILDTTLIQIRGEDELIKNLCIHPILEIQSEERMHKELKKEKSWR